MKRELVDKLVLKAGLIASDFSRLDRQFNTNQETFKVVEIKPLSDTTAVVIFTKEPTGKKALAFLYYINGGNGTWQYFFPTDGHILGMERVGDALLEIEAFNFAKNYGL